MIWCLEFEALQEAYAKSKSILDTEEGPPKFLIKSLGELEDFVQTVRVEGGEGEGGEGEGREGVREGGGAAVILILGVVGS